MADPSTRPPPPACCTHPPRRRSGRTFRIDSKMPVRKRDLIRMLFREEERAKEERAALEEERAALERNKRLIALVDRIKSAKARAEAAIEWELEANAAIERANAFREQRERAEERIALRAALYFRSLSQLAQRGIGAELAAIDEQLAQCGIDPAAPVTSTSTAEKAEGKTEE